MDMSTLNIWAVLAAAVSTFLIGAIWYAKPLFGNAWMKVNGFTEEKLKEANMGVLFLWAFILALIMAFNLGMMLNAPEIDLQMGALYGFLTGFGFVMMGIGTVALFEQRGWKYIFINGGYMCVAFTVMGIILGAWK